jgi:hypothetical protein
MGKVYTIETVIPYEQGMFHGVYSSPSAVAAWLDDHDEWEDKGVGFTAVVREHVVDGALLDPDYDYDGKHVPKARFKPFSEMA